MAKSKLTVTTPEGTFTRTTARTYTHLVVAGPTRAEVAEDDRLKELAHCSKAARRYAQLKDVDGKPLEPRWWDRAAAWAAEEAQRAAHLANRGRITSDQGTTGVLCWNSRLDLAMTEARRDTSQRFRTVRVYEVATGKMVAEFVHERPATPAQVAAAAASGEIFETAKAITDDLKAAKALADFQREFGGPADPAAPADSPYKAGQRLVLQVFGDLRHVEIVDILHSHTTRRNSTTLVTRRVDTGQIENWDTASLPTLIAQVKTCGHCGGFHLADRSCGCFDNGCQ